MEHEEASTSFALARILSIHQGNAGASEGHAHHSRPYNLCPACIIPLLRYYLTWIACTLAHTIQNLWATNHGTLVLFAINKEGVE